MSNSSDNYEVYKVLSENPFSSTSYDNPFFSNGRFFLLSQHAVKNQGTIKYINLEIVNFLLNDRSDSASYHLYRSMDEKLIYHRIDKKFYEDVDKILKIRSCLSITPEVCMVLRAIAYKFNPWYDSNREDLKKVDKTKIRSEKKLHYIKRGEEDRFHKMMLNIIESLDKGYSNLNFDNILFKRNNKNVPFDKGWLSDKILDLYRKGAFGSPKVEPLSALYLSHQNNAEINKHYKYAPAHRMYNLFEHIMNKNKVKKTATEAKKMIGELYALLLIFPPIDETKLERNIADKTKSALDEYYHKFGATGKGENHILKMMDFDMDREKEIERQKMTNEAYDKRRQKNIAKWVIKNSNAGKADSGLIDATEDEMGKLFIKK